MWPTSFLVTCIYIISVWESHGYSNTKITNDSWIPDINWIFKIWTLAPNSFLPEVQLHFQIFARQVHRFEIRLLYTSMKETACSQCDSKVHIEVLKMSGHYLEFTSIFGWQKLQITCRWRYWSVFCCNLHDWPSIQGSVHTSYMCYPDSPNPQCVVTWQRQSMRF